jgi:hypothetical protein
MPAVRDRKSKMVQGMIDVQLLFTPTLVNVALANAGESRLSAYNCRLNNQLVAAMVWL